VSPQGLIAPVPLGWSVLLGADIQLPSPDSHLPSALLRIPLMALGAADPQTITAAIWDDTAQQWLAGPSPALTTSTLDVDLSTLDSLLSTLNSLIQLALLVADASPAAPPPPVVGEPIQGVGPVQGSADSGSVIADPLVILAGTNGSAFVLTQAHSTTPLPSGTLLRVDLREHYTLRDGSEVTGTVATEEVVGYQLSPSTSTSLAAYFRLVPSRNYGLGELRSAQVDIALSLAEAAGNVALIDSNGGTVNGPSGLRLVVPPHAATGGSLLTLVPVAPASLPAGAGTRADFVGAFTLQVSGGGLDPLAAYRLGLGATVADGQQFVIGRLGGSDQRSELVFVALGHSDGGDIVIDACPSGLGGCLAGLDGSGTYAVFALPAPVAIVTGTVADSTGPRAGIPVGSDQLPVVSVTDASGRYVLPAPVGVSSTLTARDTANDLSGSASVLPSPDSQLPSPPLTADIELRPSPPQVVQTNPPNHASQVERSAVVTVTFSKAIDPASITEASVLLLQAASRVTSTTHESAVRRSLSADSTQLVITPTNLLAPNTVYQLTLTSAVSDRHGNGLQGSGASGQGSGAFVSDFTTAAIFKADALPPNTLRVSLPVDGQGNVIGTGTEIGQVFVCGGANLAAPGTAVVVQNATSQVTYTASATDANGVSGSDPSTGSGQGVCDVLFPGRCDTAAPGAFCAVVDAAIGDKVQVQVQDVLHNTVTLDAGNMTDERTGATAIPPEGGVVTYPADPRYQALVPDGAFAVPTIVQITPITTNGVGLSLADYPVLTSLDQGKIELVSAVQLDFEGTAQRNIDISVPAPPDASAEGQYIATQVVNFRGFDEQTMVDTATFDAAGCALDLRKCLVTTDPAIFPGLTMGATFGVHRANECLAYATGWISIGDHFNNGYIPGGDLGAMLPFPVQATEPVRFAVPLPCNQPIRVQLHTFAEAPIDDKPCAGVGGTTGLNRGEVCELLGVLTDDTKPPAVQSATVTDGDNGVDPLRPVQFIFDESLAALGADSQPGALLDSNGRPVKGRWELTPDGRTLTFVPDIRLRYGEEYTLQVSNVTDRGGNALVSAYSATFTTFQPVVLQHIDMDARDVVWLDPAAFPPSAGLSPCSDLIGVAEGNGLRADFLGGVSIYDVSDLSVAPPLVTSTVTAGIDRALVFLPGPPIPTTGQEPTTLNGPFLMSVDGPGGPDRFGVWRLFNLEHFPTLDEVATRLINQSSDSWDTLNLQDPLGSPPPDFLRFIPNDLGIPEDLAATDTQVAYIANAPNIGLQGIVVQGMNTDPLATLQVDGTLSGFYRSVAQFGDFVLGLRQDGSGSTLVLARPELVSATGQPLITSGYPLPSGGLPLSVTALRHWPSRQDFGAADTTAMDLAVVSGAGQGIVVVPVSRSGAFDDRALVNGVGQLSIPGSRAMGAAADPATQLLFVADGTAGLRIIDLATPGGSRDDDHDGVDDRVLGTVDLGGAQAQRVAVWRNRSGKLVVGVAAGRDGLFIIDPPAEAVNPTLARCGLRVIDAQFAPYRDKFTEGEQTGRAPEDLAEVLLQNVPPPGDPTDGMSGAVADGLSRLVLRQEVPDTAPPIVQVRFRLTTAVPIGTNHATERNIPAGSLSRDGFFDFTKDLTVDTQLGPDGRRVAIAVYTPPVFFPYVTGGSPVGTIDLEIKSESSTGIPLSKTALRLVRPPLLVQHGLFGSGARAISPGLQEVLARNGVLFSTPDFEARNISGFDRVFDVLPNAVRDVTAKFRQGRGNEVGAAGQRWKTALTGQNIAITKTDVLAHSMGGVLVRWYTTEQIGGSARPQTAAALLRQIQYPADSDAARTDVCTHPNCTILAGGGLGYFPLNAARADALLYRRADNFLQGDFGSVVVYGAPLRGSPFANDVTHRICEDQARCYVAPEGVAQLALQAALKQQTTDEARRQSDAGTAIYDLAIGSRAYELFRAYPSEPVRVHAIATTADKSKPKLVERTALALATSPEVYCPGFDEHSSDRIVPVRSQLANLGHGSVSQDAWHNAQDESRRVQTTVVQLLVDNQNGTDPVESFDPAFREDPVYPLECGVFP